jgi:superfamily I DNA/RNA helicase
MLSARLIGGAGTGKTTELLQIMKAIVAEGNEPTQIGFGSLTRAAREEMVSRASEAFGCPPDSLEKGGWFKTAHATCHRMLGIKDDQLLAADDKAAQWVADRLRVSVSWQRVDDSGFRKCVGDDEAASALTLWDIARNRVESLTEIHREKTSAGIDVPSLATVRHFVRLYELWKKADGKVDFVDVLGRFAGWRFGIDGPEQVDPEGDSPKVVAWIFDEAQDASKLLDSVCRRLAHSEGVKWAYLAADPFQSIFGFGGADYRNFLSWPVNKERTMPQSWRCPKAIMDLGERCLKRMRTGYFDRGIAPAEHFGRVIQESSIERALSGVTGCRSTLILARCKFSLVAFSEILQARKIPHAYLNEKSDTKKLMACNAYWKIQGGHGVSYDEWAAAISLTPTKAIGSEVLLRRGEKAAWGSGKRQGIEWMHQDEIIPLGGATPELMQIVKEGRWAGLLDGAGRWYEMARRHGAEVATSPQVRLSTIHGAKGMEAQDVILATETAGRVEREREIDPRCHDEECRLEYVAVTRAKENLIVCDSETPFSMELPL